MGGMRSMLADSRPIPNGCYCLISYALRRSTEYMFAGFQGRLQCLCEQEAPNQAFLGSPKPVDTDSGRTLVASELRTIWRSKEADVGLRLGEGVKVPALVDYLDL